jgi:hypothetical protein
MAEPPPEIPIPANPDWVRQTNRKPPNGSVHKPRQPKPVLAPEPSAELRDQLVAEIHDLKDTDDLALWAHRRLSAKNALTADDARAVEAAYQAVLDATNRDAQGQPEVPGQSSEPRSTSSENEAAVVNGSAADDQKPTTAETVSPLRKSVRRRNKVHLAFVAAQPCLVCQRSPCDAHHLKFAQPRTLGRKVSDEFTVPLCRDHHRDLHRYGNEVAWWANLQIVPIEVAKDLWQATLLDSDVSLPRKISHQPHDRATRAAD